MVTAETGNILFQGKSGKTYGLSFYSSDVVGASCPMSLVGTAGTGSQTFWIAPEPVVMADISITTGNTVATSLSIYANDIPTGNVVSEAAILNTLANRTFPRVPLKAGTKFTLIQA